MNDNQSIDKTLEQLKEEVLQLKNEKRALIIAHNYQRAEVQDIADHLGDSLELSRIAAQAEAPVIVFCGVHFMAETAAILSPQKTILLPVKQAGCALADSATGEQVLKMREKYPDAVFITYVNSSAEVKAVSDICCTSANAVEAVRSVDSSKTIVFVSDKNLGAYAARQTGRHVILWEGECPTHDLLSAMDIQRAKALYPGAKVIAHPECPKAVLDLVDCVASTSGMLSYAKAQAEGTSMVVATEEGILHRLKKENPGKTFYRASDYLVCPTMKMTTLQDVRDALLKNQYIVEVDEPIRSNARKSLEAMLAIPRQN